MSLRSIFLMSLATAFSVSAVNDVMVVRTSSGATRSFTLDSLEEVTFADASICVKSGGADFTIAEDEFVSIKFNADQTGISEVAEIDEYGSDAVYDLNGRFVGRSADSLAKGVYVVVKPGRKAEKLVVK